MRSPYRVAVWGPGLVGSAALRQVIRLPEFELIGVYVYSDSKNEVDAGQLVGLEPVGIKATNNREEFLGLNAEVVVYTARDIGDFAADDDILALLRAGKNVVTSLPYHYPKVRGQGVVDELEMACRAGDTTLFASGLYPGFIPEHIATALTVAVDDIEHIRIMETFEASGLGSPEMLTAFGWGCAFDPDNTQSPAYIMSKNYYAPIVQLLADQMGIQLDKIEGVCKSEVAEEDIQVGELLIAEGTVAIVSYEWIGYVDDKPFLVLKPHWYMTEALQPPEATSEECWIINIEGTPSLQCKVNAQASFVKNQRLADDDPTYAGYYISAIPLIRSIPSVVEAPAGIKIFQLGDQAWRRDLRSGN